MSTKASRAIACGLCVAIVPATSCAASAANGEGETFRLIRTHESGEIRTYVALIERPTADLDTGYSVMMIGGGFGWDLHWTLPGSYEADGEVVRLTIDGEPTRDGDAIAQALLGAGYTVLRWSTIYLGDPLHKENPAFMTPIKMGESFDLTRLAIEAFRERSGFDKGKLVLLGHSLGAARAGVVATADDVAGFVLLAGAYISPTRESPAPLANAALARRNDANGDGVLSRDEFTGDAAAFTAADVDGDGLLRGWELAAHDRRNGSISIDDTGDVWIGGEPWPSKAFETLDRPVLAVFGGLDPISVHGPWLEDASRSGRLHSCTVEYFADLGHNLSEEDGGLARPISDAVLDSVTAWLTRTLPETLDEREEPGAD